MWALVLAALLAQTPADAGQVRVVPQAKYETVYYGVLRDGRLVAVLRCRRYTLTDGTVVYRDLTLPGTYSEDDAVKVGWVLAELALRTDHDWSALFGKLDMPIEKEP